MEGVAATAYTGLKSYWRRKAYRRLNHNHHSIPIIHLGSQQSTTNNDNKRRRFRLPKPKLKLGRFRLGLSSVRKFLLKIRDAYVNAMLGFASKGMIYGAGSYCGGAVDGGMCGKGHVKEYDEKMLVEIYKKMVLTRQQQGMIVAGGGRRVASEVAPVSSVQ